jgi:D-alanyl-D-alanine carboxypeptidase/D-alanyl-D-alanine-endopeptidase (penicillin-binding protein 4)
LGEGWCWDDDNPTLSPLLIDRKDKFIEKLMQQLRNARIYLDIRQGEQVCPAGTTELCTRTHTMDEVLQPMMKNSNNLFAESMFYQLANRMGGKWATAKHARTAVQQVMKKAGIDPKPYYIADGSGLSLYSYLSAEMEVKMLRYAYQNRDIYNHLYASMPIAGVDGTLSGRMGKTSAARNVHAKTGTVTGVSSLAGYCTAANGHELCFSIMNQGMQSHAPARAFQDRVCVAMCRAYEP